MSSVGVATFKAVADFSQVRTEAAKTEAALKGMDDAATAPVGTGRDWKKTAGKMKQTGRSMTVGVTLPLALLAAGALKSYTAFEDALASIQANTKATEEQMGAVSARAKQLGQDTAFGATDAANAMYMLSTAGFDIDQSMTAVESTMLLASASGVELSDATDLVAKSMNAFGLEAEQAGHVADVFTQAANQSTATVEDLHFGMAQAGQLGAKYGQSLETVTAGLSALIDQGVPAASAGVGLRQAFDKLAAPTTRAAGFIDELGMQFRNADGSMKQMPEVVAELEKGLGGLSKAQKDQAMQAIFGVEGGKAMTLMMNAQYEASRLNADGQASLAKITDVMGQAWVDAHMDGDTFVATGAEAAEVLTLLNEKSDGTAAAFDDVKAKTLGRQIEQLGGAFENLFIALGESNKGPLLWIVQALQGIVGWLARLIEAHPAIGGLLVGFMALLAILGPLLVMTAHVITAYQTLSGLMLLTKIRMVAFAIAAGIVKTATMIWTAMQWLLNAALTANPIGVVIMAIAALVAAIVWLWNNNETFRKYVTAAWEGIKITFKAVVDFVKKYLMPIFKTYFAIWKKQWEIAWIVVKTVVGWLIGYWKTMYTFFRNIVGGIWSVWKGLWDGFANIVTSVWSFITGVISAGFKAISDGLERVKGYIVGFAEAIRNAPILSLIFDAMFWARDKIVPMIAGWLGFSEGGIVPGSGNRDSVPTMLTPGEGVIPADVMRRIGSRQFEALLAGKPMFAPQTTPAKVSRSVDDHRTVNVAVYNAKPEPASDSLPRTMRKLAYTGVL